MSTLDHEQFEKYLKQFRPIATEMLPAPTRKRWTRRSVIFAARAAAFACVLVALALALRFDAKPKQSRDRFENKTTVVKATEQGLTVRSANALLADSPSVKSALDSLAFRPQPAQQRNGKRSALDVLSEEKNQL